MYTGCFVLGFLRTFAAVKPVGNIDAGDLIDGMGAYEVLGQQRLALTKGLEGLFRIFFACAEGDHRVRF